MPAVITDAERHDRPYITAELDFGGFPFWLTTVPGIALRTNNTVYLGCVDRLLDRLVPVLLPFQYTQGGPIVDIQVCWFFLVTAT